MTLPSIIDTSMSIAEARMLTWIVSKLASDSTCTIFTSEMAASSAVSTAGAVVKVSISPVLAVVIDAASIMAEVTVLHVVAGEGAPKLSPGRTASVEAVIAFPHAVAKSEAAAAASSVADKFS